MGKRGTRPTPTAVKLARGTHRPDRHGDPDSEPHGALLGSVPVAPETLGEVGGAKWQEWGQHLASLGLLEQRYLDALEMYCRAWDRLAEYERILREDGEFVKTTKGYVCRHPAATGAKQARDDIRRYQVEFGFTPSSSASVKTTKVADNSSKSRFFNRQA